MNTISSALPLLESSDERIRVGQFTYGRPRLLLWSDHERIEIGSFCSIADDVTILGGGEHNVDWVSTFPLRIAFGDPRAWSDGHPKMPERPTKIGSDVWLGFGSTVLGGAEIGDGAVIGARAVIAGHVPPYCIALGNPAKVVRARFSMSQIDALIQIKWWNWPLQKLKKYVDLLSSNRIDEFIEAARVHVPNDQ